MKKITSLDRLSVLIKEGKKSVYDSRLKKKQPIGWIQNYQFRLILSMIELGILYEVE